MFLPLWTGDDQKQRALAIGAFIRRKDESWETDMCLEASGLVSLKFLSFQLG
jgi:hypothetical protein